MTFEKKNKQRKLLTPFGVCVYIGLMGSASQPANRGKIMNTRDEIVDFNNSARKAFGDDIRVQVARSPAFGHNDFCFIVSGRKQDDVADALLRFVMGGVITKENRIFMGLTRETTTVVGGFVS
jgi:hypothetical protein